MKRVCQRGRDLLANEPDLAARLDPVPTIAWTRRPIRDRWAYWAPRIAGKGRGTPLIRVNRRLRTLRCPPFFHQPFGPVTSWV